MLIQFEDHLEVVRGLNRELTIIKAAWQETLEIARCRGTKLSEAEARAAEQLQAERELWDEERDELLAQLSEAKQGRKTRRKKGNRA